MNIATHAPNGWHRLSSRGLSTQACEQLFWDRFNGNVMRFDWKPLDGALALEADVRALPGLRVAAGRGRAMAQRTRETIADGNDDLVFLINVDSRVWITQRGNEASLAPGGAFFGTCTEPFIQAGDLGIGLRLERAAIAHLVPDLDDRVSRFVPSDSPITRLIIGYVQALRNSRVADHDAARFAALHIHDLVALAIGAPRDAAQVAAHRGLGAARLLAIRQDIATSIGRRPIDAETMARRHGISPRYLRTLFQRDGGDFAADVLNARLDRAAELLRDARSIETVARAVGLDDIVAFRRSFSSRHGFAPDEAFEQT